MITVLKGGTSSEREVSLWTAASVVKSLHRLGHEVCEVDAAEPTWLTQCHGTEVVIIALHGPFGEDGTVQELLEKAGIRFTGSGSESARLTIDKVKTKEVAVSLDIPVPHSSIGSWDGDYPAVVKPNREGSSFGVSIVQSARQLESAIETARKLDATVLVEEYLEGTEVTCGVISVFGKLQALPLVEIRPKTAFFDFKAKYDATQCDEICPAEISPELSSLIQQQTQQLFTTLGCRQYARADWIIKDGTPHFLEINSLPGMTKASLITKELAAAGIEFDDFIAALIETA